MTRAIGYVRVSCESQSERGVSLAAQEAKLRSYAALYDVTLVEVIVDAAASARSLDRPGLQRALAALKRGDADALLVAKLDRLTRSVGDLGVLVERHFQRAALLSVAEQVDTRTAGGRLVLNVLGSVSQWEREAIGERTSAALRHKRSVGERVGSVPFGYRLDDDGVHLVPDHHEQRTVSAARCLRERGYSFGRIARILAARGAKSRAGRQFAPEQVRRMVMASAAPGVLSAPPARP